MDGLDLGEGNLVYGVIVKTKTGNYGMLQLENIWKGGSELAWSAGFKTTEVHGNSLRSTPYAATSGDTIVEISYLTSKGEYSVHLADGLYLPKKHNGTVTAESVAVAAGSIPVTDNNSLFPVESSGTDNIPENSETLSDCRMTIGKIKISTSFCSSL